MGDQVSKYNGFNADEYIEQYINYSQQLTVDRNTETTLELQIPLVYFRNVKEKVVNKKVYELRNMPKYSDLLYLVPEIFPIDSSDIIPDSSSIPCNEVDSGFGSTASIPNTVSGTTDHDIISDETTELKKEIDHLKSELVDLKDQKLKSDSVIASYEVAYDELINDFAKLRAEKNSLYVENKNYSSKYDKLLSEKVETCMKYDKLRDRELMLKDQISRLSGENERYFYKEVENKNILTYLSQNWKIIEVENERNCRELELMRGENLHLSQKLSNIMVPEPEVIVKYIQVEEQPKWFKDFEDIQDELTDEERSYVLNSIATKKTREFLVKKVHRRRNGDFESFAEKSSKTQKYIEHMKKEHLVKIEKMDIQYRNLLEDYYNEIDVQEDELQGLDSEISNLNNLLSGEKMKFQKMSEHFRKTEIALKDKLHLVNLQLKQEECVNKIKEARVSQVRNKNPTDERPKVEMTPADYKRMIQQLNEYNQKGMFPGIGIG